MKPEETYRGVPKATKSKLAKGKQRYAKEEQEQCQSQSQSTEKQASFHGKRQPKTRASRIPVE